MQKARALTVREFDAAVVRLTRAGGPRARAVRTIGGPPPSPTVLEPAALPQSIGGTGPIDASAFADGIAPPPPAGSPPPAPPPAPPSSSSSSSKALVPTMSSGALVATSKPPAPPPAPSQPFVVIDTAPVNPGSQSSASRVHRFDASTFAAALPANLRKEHPLMFEVADAVSAASSSAASTQQNYYIQHSENSSNLLTSQSSSGHSSQAHHAHDTAPSSSSSSSSFTPAADAHFATSVSSASADGTVPASVTVTATHTSPKKTNSTTFRYVEFPQQTRPNGVKVGGRLCICDIERYSRFSRFLFEFQ